MDHSLLILSGTLCGDELWSNFVNHLIQSNAIARERIHYGNLYGGLSMHNMGQRIGEYAKTIGKPWILGYSLGGVVALEVVRHYQPYIAGLILVCTKANGRNPDKDAALNKERQLLNEQGLDAVLETLLLPAYFADRMQQHPLWVERVRNSGLNLGKHELVNQRHTFQTRDEQYPYLNKITIPTHIVYGTEDILCTPHHSQEIHRRIPHSTIVAYPDVGHDLPWLCHKQLANDTLTYITNTTH